MNIFKIITLVLYTMLAIVFTSCEDAGVARKRLNGDEQNIPDELKGLKVYSVSTGNGNYVKVGILNDKINSTTYNVGKTDESIIIIDKQRNDKIIKVSEILVENDSIIVCRK